MRDTDHTQLTTLNTLDMLKTLDTLDTLSTLATLTTLGTLTRLGTLTLGTLKTLDTLTTLDSPDTLTTPGTLMTLGTLTTHSTLMTPGTLTFCVSLNHLRTQILDVLRDVLRQCTTEYTDAERHAEYILRRYSADIPGISTQNIEYLRAQMIETCCTRE